MQPLVSILIPAYNAQPWIADAIKSALGQTWSRIEVIVIDDGSKDGTLEIARKYVSDKVRVLTQENRGASVTRNRAFAESQGYQLLEQYDLVLRSVTEPIDTGTPMGETIFAMLAGMAAQERQGDRPGPASAPPATGPGWRSPA